MTSDGSPYSRFQRALRSGNLALIHATAVELPYVPLTDALAILLVLDARHEERFNAAAVRWAGRLATEVRRSSSASSPARSSRWSRCPTSAPRPRC